MEKKERLLKKIESVEFPKKNLKLEHISILTGMEENKIFLHGHGVKVLVIENKPDSKHAKDVTDRIRYFAPKANITITKYNFKGDYSEFDVVCSARGSLDLSSRVDDAIKKGTIFLFSAGNNRKDYDDYPKEPNQAKWINIVALHMNPSSGKITVAPYSNDSGKYFEFAMITDMSGTSFAQPIVSAMACRLKQIIPEITQDEFEEFYSKFILLEYKNECKYGMPYEPTIQDIMNTYKSMKEGKLL